MQFCNRVIQYIDIPIRIFADAFAYAIEVFTACLLCSNKKNEPTKRQREKERESKTNSDSAKRNIFFTVLIKFSFVVGAAKIVLAILIEIFLK